MRKSQIQKTKPKKEYSYYVLKGWIQKISFDPTYAIYYFLDIINANIPDETLSFFLSSMRA